MQGMLQELYVMYYYNMNAISFHDYITDQLSDTVMVIAICIGTIEK